MRKMTTVHRVGVVGALSAALIGLGGATSAAFAEPTSPVGGGILGTSPCPDGWTGIELIVDGIPLVLCTNI